MDLHFSDDFLHTHFGPFGFLFGKLRLRPCSVHSYSHDALLEVAAEGVGLVALDLPVLHGAAPQVIIQLRSVDSCAALLILRGVLPNPEVDVLGEDAAHSPGLGCSQRDQVRGQLASPSLLSLLAWEEHGLR